jgi:hypothetical protein
MANLYGGINFYVFAPAPAGCTPSPPDMAGTCGSTHDMAAADLSWIPMIDEAFPRG